MIGRENSRKAHLLNFSLCTLFLGDPARICLPRVCSFSSTCDLSNFFFFNIFIDYAITVVPYLISVCNPRPCLCLLESHIFMVPLNVHRNKFLLLICLMLMWLLAQLELREERGKLFFWPPQGLLNFLMPLWDNACQTLGCQNYLGSLFKMKTLPQSFSSSRSRWGLIIFMYNQPCYAFSSPQVIMMQLVHEPHF